MLLLLALACSPSPAAPAGDEALAGQYLVVLGYSSTGEEPFGVRQLAAHPELGLVPRTLQSQRFADLLPCEVYTYVAASPDRTAMLNLTHQLKALGISSGVYFTGAWLGPDPVLDAKCAAPVTPAARPSEGVLKAIGTQAPPAPADTLGEANPPDLDGALTR